MGCGGSASMANSSLKYNRSLIGKHKFKTKGLMLKKSSKTELKFKKVSPLELSKIKRQIRLDAKKKTKRTNILTVLIVFTNNCRLFIKASLIN